MKRTSTSLIALGAAAAVLALAGCGGGDEDSTSVGGGTGNDISIQAFGAESSAEERTQAATTAQAYLNARRAGQWEKACSYLNETITEGFTRLGDQIAQRGGGSGSALDGCAGAMKVFTTKVPAATLRRSATIEKVLSFRVEDEQGFLIFEGFPKTTRYSFPMDLEGDEWKVGSIVPNALPAS